MEELLPNLTAAIYKTEGRQCTKLYGGNLPNCTAAIGIGAWWHPDKTSWKMSKVQNSPEVLLYFNRLLFDRQLINIIVDLFSPECRNNERSQISGKIFPYILR